MKKRWGDAYTGDKNENGEALDKDGNVLPNVDENGKTIPLTPTTETNPNDVGGEQQNQDETETPRNFHNCETFLFLL